MVPTVVLCPVGVGGTAVLAGGCLGGVLGCVLQCPALSVMDAGLWGGLCSFKNTRIN